MKTIQFSVAAIGVMALVALLAPEFAYSEKNPQAESSSRLYKRSK